MSDISFGQLEKVDLRKAWKDEAGDFTPWLAEEDNLKLLGDAIGIELELDSVEKMVGTFYADILCKNIVDGSWVLIENQLEKTDHKHFGQLLTYAFGLNANTIIWIAKRFTNEHRAALDRLNDITDDEFRCFGIEIELCRIGDSDIAPLFNIVAKPNVWTKSVKRGTGEVSDIGKAQLEFWTAFGDYLDTNNSRFNCNNPRPKVSMRHHIAVGGFYLITGASTYNSVSDVDEPVIRVDLTMSSSNSKKYYAMLEEQREEIEKEYGDGLIWVCKEGVKKRRVFVQKPSDFFNSVLWPEQHQWLEENLTKFTKVFAQRVNKIRALNKSG